MTKKKYRQILCNINLLYILNLFLYFAIQLQLITAIEHLIIYYKNLIINQQCGVFIPLLAERCQYQTYSFKHL